MLITVGEFGVFDVCRIWDNCEGHNVFVKVTAGVIKDRKSATSENFLRHVLATPGGFLEQSGGWSILK